MGKHLQTYSDGSKVVNIGTSNLPVSLNVAESLSTQQSQMAAEAQQRWFSLSQGSSKSLANSYRNMAQLSDALGQSEHMSDSVTQGISTEQSKAIQKSVGLMEKFAKDNHIDVTKAADLFAEVSAGGGLFVKGSVGGKTHLSASDQTLLAKATQFMKDRNFQESVKEAAHAAKNLSHTVSDESTRRFSEEISGSYEKGMSQREEASKSFSESESYTRQAMATRANAASINANYNQQFFEWLSNQPADNAQGRMGERSAAYILTNDPKMAASYANRFMETHGLIPQAELPSPPIRQNYEKDKQHERYPVNQRDVESVRNEGGMHNNLSKGKDFRATAQQDMEMAGQRIERGESEIYQQGQGVQSEFKKQEGRSVIARTAEAFQKETAGTDEEIAERVRQAYQPGFGNYSTSDKAIDSVKKPQSQGNAHIPTDDFRSDPQRDALKQDVHHEERVLHQREQTQQAVEKREALNFAKETPEKYKIEPQQNREMHHRYPASEGVIATHKTDRSSGEIFRPGTQQDIRREEYTTYPKDPPQAVEKRKTLGFGHQAHYQGEPQPKGESQHDRHPTNERSIDPIRNEGVQSSTYSNKVEDWRDTTQQETSVSKQDVGSPRQEESLVSQGVKGSHSGFKTREEHSVISRNADLLANDDSNTDESADTGISGEVQHK